MPYNPGDIQEKLGQNQAKTMNKSCVVKLENSTTKKLKDHQRKRALTKNYQEKSRERLTGEKGSETELPGEQDIKRSLPGGTEKRTEQKDLIAESGQKGGSTTWLMPALV
ncbi:unnamed protein product [Pieris macdunnoughi]|uniref:Uncharacterized protein n=1 Tax=Pieris macdunnoughi TaxID=345717 RepID=A0A821NLS4_9NEOP|nr:unnamed protein product [Pieris macdunnoughi]